MLSKAPITAFLSTTDAARAKAFYGGTLGLRFLDEDGHAIVFETASAPLRIQKVKSVMPQPFTALGWQVADIRDAVRALVKRGVAFERYAYFEQDEDGVWLAPSGTRVAWFKDPEGHLLSLSQSP